MTPLVSEGLNLAIYGMGTVFVFLTLLVLVTMAMSSVVAMMGVPEAASAPAGSENKKIAAITAAIHAHRQKNS